MPKKSTTKKHIKVLDMLYDCQTLISEIYNDSDIEAITEECQEDPAETIDAALQAVIQMDL